MWSQVLKHTHTKVSAPGVRRYDRHTKVFMPKHMAHADRVDFYHDSDGRLAYQFKKNGQYKVTFNGAKAEITVPAKLRFMIPDGIHHNIDIRVDGGLTDGMYVIDTRQFEAEDNRRVPAE